MVLNKLRRYLSIMFFTALIFSQGLVFVAVQASAGQEPLSAVFIEPVSQNIEIGTSLYFQAMLSTSDQDQFDFVTFNLKNISSGINENYQASLEDDGTFKAQSAWDTKLYKTGEYYLSAVAYDYEDGQVKTIYSSDYFTINLYGQVKASADSTDVAYFTSPSEGTIFDRAQNPSLSIKLSVESVASDTIEDMSFIVAGGGTQYIYTAKLVSSITAYQTWQNSQPIDLSTYAVGTYSIRPQINTSDLTSNPSLEEQFNNITPVNFAVETTSISSAPSDPNTVDIISPIDHEIVTGDSFDISVNLDNPLTGSSQHVVAVINYVDSNLLVPAKEYNLEGSATDNTAFGFLVDVGDGQPSGPNSTYTVADFPDGNYNMVFYWEPGAGLDNTVLGSVRFSIARAVSQPGDNYTISLNDPQAGATITSANLFLDFSTNFAAEDVYFELVKADDATIGLDDYIPSVAGSFSWRYTVSSELNPEFSNGDYILSATASDAEGNTASLGPVSFFWQINDEVVVVDPYLAAYTSTTQLGPSNILMGVANVADVNFRLRSTQASGASYSFSPITTSCNNTTVLSGAAISGAAALEPSYCFYMNLSRSDARVIVNGNYYFYLEHDDGTDTLSSNQILLSYFNPNNDQADDDPIDDNSDIPDDNSSDQADDSQNDDSTQTDTPTNDSGQVPDDNSSDQADDDPIDDNSDVPDDTEDSGQAIDNISPSRPVVVSDNVVIDSLSTCEDLGISDPQRCRAFLAIRDSLDTACLEQGIYDALACEDYLYRMRIDMECQDKGIIDREECKNYLLEQYGGKVDCRLDDTNLCNNILRNRYLSRLVVGQKLSDSVDEVVSPLFGQNVSTKQLSDNLQSKGIGNTDVLPLPASDRTKVLVARAQKETVLESENDLTILGQAVIVLDSDGDGLADDLEEYYGTDINNPDTDSDGYTDGVEIVNGYDPAGDGKLIKARTSLDSVLLSEDKTLEQPKAKSDKADDALAVEAVDKSSKNIKLSGRAEPDSWVTLYLYSSLPLVMTTKTDASGNWSYDIKNSLTDGHHRVFVTVNDDTGKIVKQSKPISFLIREAQAVTVDDYFDQSSSSEAVDNLFIYYILGGALLVIFALGIIIFLNKSKNRNLEI